MRTALVSLLLCAAASAASAQSAADPRFVGTWRLVSITGLDTTAARSRGAKPTGYIYYDASGHMGVQIQPSRKRPSWSAEKPLTADEALDVVRGYTAYFGTWTVDAATGTVTHHREGALNLDAVDYVRRFAFEGSERLILSPVDMRGVSLTWERVR